MTDHLSTPDRCEHVQPLLVAYLAGEEEGAERAAIESHLRGCDDCSALLSAIQGNLKTLENAPDAAPSSRAWRSISTQLDLRRPATADAPDAGRATSLDELRGVTVRRMPAYIALTLFAAAVLALAAWYNWPRAVPDDGALVTAQGTLLIQTSDASDWTAWRSGDAVPVGARLRTGDGAQAFLVLPDNVKIHLRPNTELHWQRANECRLDAGLLECVVPAGASSTSITTPLAVQECRHGRFLLRAEPDATVLTCLEGLVIQTNNKGTVEIKAGKQTRVLPNQTPSQPVYVDTEALANGEYAGEPAFSLRLEVPDSAFEADAYVPVTANFMNAGKQLVRITRVAHAPLELVLEIRDPSGRVREMPLPRGNMSESGQAELGDGVVTLGYQDDYAVGFLLAGAFGEAGEYTVKASYQQAGSSVEEMWTGKLESNTITVVIR